MVLLPPTVALLLITPARHSLGSDYAAGKSRTVMETLGQHGTAARDVGVMKFGYLCSDASFVFLGSRKTFAKLTCQVVWWAC